MITKLTSWLLKNPWRPAVLAAILSFIPLLGWIGSILVGLVTLALGAQAGLIVVIFAMSGDVLQVILGDIAALWNILFFYIYVWLIAVTFKKTESWSDVLNITSVLLIAIMGMIHMVVDNVSQWWYQHLLAFWEKLQHALIIALDNTQVSSHVTSVGEQSSAYLQPVLANMIDPHVLLAISVYLTGLVVLLTLLSNLVNFMIARGWYLFYHQARGLKQAVLLMRISPIFTGLFLLTVIVAKTVMPQMLDFAVGLGGLVLLSSLVCCHWLAEQVKYTWLWLLAGYTMLILYPIPSVFLLMSIGILDSFLNIRIRCFNRNV